MGLLSSTAADSHPRSFENLKTNYVKTLELVNRMTDRLFDPRDRDTVDFGGIRKQLLTNGEVDNLRSNIEYIGRKAQGVMLTASRDYQHDALLAVVLICQLGSLATSFAHDAEREFEELKGEYLKQLELVNGMTDRVLKDRE